MKRVFSFFFLFFCFSSPALAHKPSDSYLSLNVKDGRITGRWDVALRDLEQAIGLDENEDGVITWGELKSRHEKIASYLLSRLRLSDEKVLCETKVLDQQVDSHSDGAYTVLDFQVECPSSLKALEVRYRLLFDGDPQHRGLLRLDREGRTQTAIFSPEKSVQIFSFNGSSGSLRHPFFEFMHEGVWHIWIGFDHILFLLALLLPSVLVRRRGGWEAVTDFRKAFLDVLKIVSSFTAAHSLTLTLASLQVVSLPSRWVESAIAFSIVVAALNNFYPFLPHRRWGVAFLFGLIHGFGFASVLTDLGLEASALVRSLIGFNFGVELGQLAIVSAFLPLAYILRRCWFYQRVAFVWGSTIVAGLASLWVVERFFNFQIAGHLFF